MRIDFDGEANTITVNGIAIALEVLEMMTNPDPRKSLRFIRIGDCVDVYQTMTEPGIGFHVEAR